MVRMRPSGPITTPEPLRSRPRVSADRAPGYRCEHEFWFGIVLAGTIAVEVDGVAYTLGPADAMTIPSGCVVRLGEASSDLEVLSVSLPANPVITRLEARHS